MKSRLVSALALALALVTGCAASASSPTNADVDHVEAAKEPIFAKKAVNVDQRFSDAVTVNDGSLVVPADLLGKIEVGSIVAGDRATKGTSNPYGFLRRVTEIERDVPKAGQATLVTEKAQLSDWIVSGRVDFRSSRSLLGGAGAASSGIVTKTLKLQGEDKQEGGGSGSASTTADTTLDEKVTVSNTSITVAASFDGYFDVRTKDLPWILPDNVVPEGIAMKAVLTIDPTVSADITWKLSNDGSVEKSWKGADVVIPIAAPIPLTVRYAPEVKCNLEASGEMSFTVHATLGAHGVFGFEGDAGPDHITLNPIVDGPTAHGDLTLKSIQGQATVSTECEVVAVPELLAFDSVGISGRIGPYAHLTATACANANAGGTKAGFTLTEEHGLTGSFSGHVQIPVLGQGTDIDLWSNELPFAEPAYLAGDANTCTAPVYDSCDGKSDGFHCSEVSPFSGIVCQGGQILKGLQCVSQKQKCAGGNASTIQCR
jgi:hypothetical protein